MQTRVTVVLWWAISTRLNTYVCIYICTKYIYMHASVSELIVGCILLLNFVYLLFLSSRMQNETFSL